MILGLYLGHLGLFHWIECSHTVLCVDQIFFFILIIFLNCGYTNTICIKVYQPSSDWSLYFFLKNKKSISVIDLFLDSQFSTVSSLSLPMAHHYGFI